MLSKGIVILIWATIIISIMLFVLLSYLIIRKSIEIRTRKLIDKNKEKLNPHIFSHLYDGSISRFLITDSIIKLKAVEELLKKYTEILEGEGELRNLTALAELHLGEYYRVNLTSSNWSKRMNALYHIEDFQMTDLKPDVLKLVNKTTSTKDELVVGLRILAAFQHQGLYELLKDKNHLSEFEYRNIFIRLNEEGLEPFIFNFHKSHHELQYAILEVMSVKKELRYVAFVESISENYSGEVRIRALKTLASIGYVKDVEKYMPLSKSSKWQERMVAAKLFGSLKDQAYITLLIDLLHDPVWWVRSQAGQSLMMFSNGKDLLQNVLRTSEDSFARDMAWEWINKGD